MNQVALLGAAMPGLEHNLMNQAALLMPWVGARLIESNCVVGAVILRILTNQCIMVNW